MGVTLKQKKNPAKWYSMNTLRGTKCTKSKAREHGMDPEAPGLVVTYGAAAALSDDEVETDEQTDEEEQTDDEAEGTDDEAEGTTDQDSDSDGDSSSDNADDQDSDDGQTGGGSYTRLKDNHSLREHMERLQLEWSPTMPVSFDLAMELTTDVASVISAPTIQYNGILYLPLHYIKSP